MNTPHLTTPLSVETLWHTNWGFAVKQIIGGKSYNYFLDYHIGGLHREYVEKFITPGKRRDHTDTKNREGTSSPLLPATTAFLGARVVSTLDDIPLDPVDAQKLVRGIWSGRIASSPHCREALQAECDNLCSQFQRVIDGALKSVIDIPGIIGICHSLAVST